MLAPGELHGLWSTLHEQRRLDFVDSLTQEAADQLFAFQLREHERKQAIERAPTPPFDDLAVVARREATREASQDRRERQRAHVGASTD
jgi:hypothetical protein